MFLITRPRRAVFITIILSALAGCFLVSFTSEAAEDQVVKVVEQASKAIVNIKTEELIDNQRGMNRNLLLLKNISKSRKIQRSLLKI